MLPRNEISTPRREGGTGVSAVATAMSEAIDRRGDRERTGRHATNQGGQAAPMMRKWNSP